MIPRIVMIDSGAPEDGASNGIELVLENGKLEQRVGANDQLGHGSGIYGIIKWHCQTAEIFTIKISGAENKKPDILLLIHALEFVYSQLEFDIVNISLSIAVSDDYTMIHRLRSLCRRITANGALIVAAFDNWGSISYPAAFSQVIGVTAGEYCYSNGEVETVDDREQLVDVCAFGKSQTVDSLNGVKLQSRGNSLACAHVTGLLATEVANGGRIGTKEFALESLKKHSVCHHTFHDKMANRKFHLNPGIRATIVFLGKETHALLRYYDLLICNIHRVADTRYSGLVGKKVSDLPNQNLQFDMIVQDVESLAINKDELIIIGHISQIIRSGRTKEIIHSFIKKCIMNSARIFSFDDLHDFFEDISSKSYYSPQQTIDDVIDAPFGKLFRIGKPVVGVFGTSSEQGKYSLQLELRRRFLRDGYKVGQLGTEPTAELFGMNECFHCGYNSKQLISGFSSVIYLNRLMERLNNALNDIIIVGCQSGFMLSDYGNIAYYPLPQIEFIFGTQPDAVLLCINATDSVDFIHRTIACIESISMARVLALVLYPVVKEISKGNIYEKRILSKTEQMDFVKGLKLELRKDIYCLDSADEMDMLYKSIIFEFDSDNNLDKENK